MTPAPVGHIFWDSAQRYGWRKDEHGYTNVFRLADGEILELWSMGTDDDGELVIKGAVV